MITRTKLSRNTVISKSHSMAVTGDECRCRSWRRPYDPQLTVKGWKDQDGNGRQADRPRSTFRQC